MSRSLVERLLNEEDGFADVTNLIKNDRSLLRHFATLHDAYFRGDTSLSSKESKTAMNALIAALWGKAPGITALGTMEPNPNVTEFTRMLDEVGEGPLGSFFGFRSPQDVPGGEDTQLPDEEEETGGESPIPVADIDPDATPADRENLDNEDQDPAWTPIAP